MYLRHFGLAEFPFAITPDTDFVYLARNQQQAMNTLRIALENGEGFIKVTGEVGTGKTLTCRRLLDSLAGEAVSAYVLNPRIAPIELLRALSREFKLKPRRGADEAALYTALQAELLRLAESGQRVVLCIDEAQAMPLETLEALRLLSNLETEKRKLIQIVLFAQPELDALLRLRPLRSLASRIAFSARLGNLRREELGGYLQHRLRVAGWCGDEVFSPLARFLLWRFSGGVPRLINTLAHQCLMLAYGSGQQRVGARLVWWAWHDATRLQLAPGLIPWLTRRFQGLAP